MRRELCDFYDLYWRVEFSDGDWDELTRRELRHGITLAAQVSSSAQEVNRLLPGHLLAPRASSWGGCGGSGADGSSSPFKTNVFIIQDQPVFSLSSDSIPGSDLEERHDQVQVSRYLRSDLV